MTVSNIDHPYRMRQDYLSSAETTFFYVLVDVVNEKFFVCPKVALSDLFFVARPNENVQYANKLLKKNIDFLLLWADTLKPALAIELDDPKQVDHRPVDEFLETLFTSSGVPLLHITARLRYDFDILTDQFTEAIKNSNDTARLHSDYSPICPNCGITMVLRFGKEGPFAGHKYYGCLNFPSCQATIPVK